MFVKLITTTITARQPLKLIEIEFSCRFKNSLKLPSATNSCGQQLLWKLI